MASYVEVVREAVGDRGDQTILIGHSMGGLVVQRAMEKVDVAGAVLVASVPRWGVGPGAVRMVRREPWTSIKATVMLDMWSFVKDEELTRQAFFRPETPQEIVSSTFDRLQNESYLAYVSMMVRPPRPGRVSTSVLVLAAEDDGIFTVEEEKQLAKAYDGDFQLIEGSGHDVMLDTRWEEAADGVLTWIKALDGSGS